MLTGYLESILFVSIGFFKTLGLKTQRYCQSGIKTRLRSPTNRRPVRRKFNSRCLHSSDGLQVGCWDYRMPSELSYLRNQLFVSDCVCPLPFFPMCVRSYVTFSPNKSIMGKCSHVSSNRRMEQESSLISRTRGLHSKGVIELFSAFKNTSFLNIQSTVFKSRVCDSALCTLCLECPDLQIKDQPGDSTSKFRIWDAYCDAVKGWTNMRYHCNPCCS